MANKSTSFSARLLGPILTPLAALVAKKVTENSFTKATGRKPPTKKSPGSFSDNLIWAIALTTMLALAQMLVQKFFEKDKN
jgi:hypothetical protein